MDPFTGMSQDEIKKIDLALQSEHAKALLEESSGKAFDISKAPILATSEVSGENALLNTSLESLSGLSDFDSLEATISVSNDVVAEISADIFHDDLPRTLDVENIVYLDHPYSLPPLSTSLNINSKSDESSPKTKAVVKKAVEQTISSPIRRSRRQIERKERKEKEKPDDSEDDYTDNEFKKPSGQAAQPRNSVPVDVLDLKHSLSTSLKAHKPLATSETKPVLQNLLEADVPTDVLNSLNTDVTNSRVIVGNSCVDTKLLSECDSAILENIKQQSVVVKPDFSDLKTTSIVLASSKTIVTKEISKPRRLSGKQSANEEKIKIPKLSNSAEKAKKMNSNPQIMRKKTVSLSEDSSDSQTIVDSKKRKLSGSEKDTKNQPKPKVKSKKKVRSDSLSADFLGPALFSAPDVMVKVKAGDDVVDVAKEKIQNDEDAKPSTVSDVPADIKVFDRLDKNDLDLLKEAMEIDTSEPAADDVKPAQADSKPDKIESIDQITKIPVVSEKESMVKVKPESETDKLGESPVTVQQLSTAPRTEKCSPAIIKGFLVSKNKGRISTSEEDKEKEIETISDIEKAVKLSSPVSTPSAVKPERKSQRTVQRKRRFSEDYSPDPPSRKKRNSNQLNTKKSPVRDVKAEPSEQVKSLPKRETRKKAVKVWKEEESGDDEGNEENDADDSDESEESEEWDSDDDPEKLWCICRKPHNNKFMIECDKCKDWFHGTCVSVTRQLGQQLEKEGKEWVCPNCMKAPAGKGPPKIARQNSKDASKQQRPKLSETNKAATKSQVKSQKDIFLKKDGTIASSGRKAVSINKPLEIIAMTQTHKEQRSGRTASRSVSKDSETSEKPSMRKPIPKDFVLKSREPAKPQKQKESPLSPVKTMKKESPVKNEKHTSTPPVLSKGEKNPCKTEKIPPGGMTLKKMNLAGTGLEEAVASGKKIVLRRVVVRNDVVVTKDSVVTVAQKIQPPQERHKSKEKVKKKYECNVCTKPAPVGTAYCSSTCLVKYAEDAIKAIKDSLKPNEDLNSTKVVVLDKETGNLIRGSNAPTVSELIPWLKTNQIYGVIRPTVPQQAKKEQVQKIEPKSDRSDRSSDAEESANEKIRLNVRQTLKANLKERSKDVDTLKMSEEEIQKIADKIEEELNNYFKDNSFKYRAKYRSLMFNIKDPRNQGLFRKILKGKISPEQLVRMSSEELASVELAKWREEENRHNLDMIKRMHKNDSI